MELCGWFCLKINNLNKMNILVTGGAGFIGTNLIKKLVQLNHIITSIDNYSTGLKSNHQDGCKYIEADITDNYVVNDLHDHSLSEWTGAWEREHQDSDRFPAVLVPLTTSP